MKSLYYWTVYLHIRVDYASFEELYTSHNVSRTHVSTWKNITLTIL